MATVAEVRKAVRPLIDRHSDLASVGRNIYLKPVHHLGKGFYISHGRWYAKELKPHVSVSALVPYSALYGRGFGERLFKKHVYGPRKLEDVHKPDWDITLPDTLENMLETIEGELPRLRAIQNFQDYRDFVANLTSIYANPLAIDYFDKFIPVLHGKFGVMLEALETDPIFLAETEQYQPGFYTALKAHDRESVAKILHEWEAASVKKLKIEKIWEPTLFPLEL